MKKLLLLFAAVGMIFTACEPDGIDEENGGNPTEQPGGSNATDPNNPLNNLTCAPNEILYTTKYGLVIELGNRQGFGGNLVYNTYEDGVGRLTFGNDVTAIPENAFKDCNSMEYIKMPNSVKSFGSNAFFNCTSLKSITIPDSVTSIGGHAFNGCTSLTSITIPDSVTSIGNSAFSGCIGELIVNSKIVETDYSDSNYPLNSWLYGSKFTNLSIGNNITKIGKYAFNSCTSLTSVTIPNSVTSIGDCAFYSCDSLTSVNISDLSAWCKISFGDNWATPLLYANKLYLNGSELTDIAIPSDITEIKNYAFEGCTSLTSVNTHNGVTSIGEYAFSHCDSLTSVTIPDSVTSIGEGAFYSCDSLTDATIGNGVTSIGDCAFYSCDSLTDVTIGNGVTSIGNYAFRNCTSLASVTIPNSVTSIGERAFYKCSSLASAIIGNSVTSIGYVAFANCSSLTSVYCKPTTPPTGGDYMFSYYDWAYNGDKPIGCKIYVPRYSVSAYKAKQYWKDYASYIVGYDF